MDWTLRWTPTESELRDIFGDLGEPRRSEAVDAEPGSSSSDTGKGEGASSVALLWQVCCRTIQARMLLKPGRINRIIHGCLARAQERAPEVKLCSYAFLSTHYHALLTAPDHPTLSYFMNCFQSTLAIEVNRLTGWGAKVWSRPFEPTFVSAEPEIQLERLRYILEQGCKENLVASPLDWPGATSHAALINGHFEIQGDWIDRTTLYERRRSGEPEFRECDVTSQNRLLLAKLPAFAHLDRHEYASMIRAIIEEIERETRERHREDGTKPLGASKILAVDPLFGTGNPKQSQRAKFHATKKAFANLCYTYRAFYVEFKAASARFRAGELDVPFPPHSFPPAPQPRGPD